MGLATSAASGAENNHGDSSARHQDTEKEVVLGRVRHSEELAAISQVSGFRADRQCRDRHPDKTLDSVEILRSRQAKRTYQKKRREK